MPENEIIQDTAIRQEKEIAQDSVVKEKEKTPPILSPKNTSKKSADNPCEAFNALNTQIRDGQIDKKTAQSRIKNLIPEIEGYYVENGGKNYPAEEWYFPLKGYDKSAIGGTNGSGYLPSGYDYFEGNKHKGHPAHDIFIRDKNQDDKDDQALEYVEVLSVTGGIVVATQPDWEAESPLRGGIYLWIYDPSCKSLFYYAHNHALTVSVGEIVSPGQSIAAVGRTGLNAYKERSPTHLHLTQLEISETGSPESVNIYSKLIKAKTKK